MSEKSTDKRKHIIRTAMELFSAKGPSATSMQEIAEHCGMSKGSLYLHFKSKVELETSIYNHCYQMLQEHLIEADQLPGLSPKEILQKQIEVLLSLVLELREFLLMQLRDWVTNGKKSMEPQCVKDNNLMLLSWAQTRLVRAYGPEIAPYAADLTLFLHGSFGSYIRLLFDSRINISIQMMSEHLMFALDQLSDGFLHKRPLPLFSAEILEQWANEGLEGLAPNRHPLQVIKSMKIRARDLSLPADRKEEVMDSLQILEQEIVELQPRRVILQGMLRNLENIPELDEEFKELEAAMLHTNSRPNPVTQG
ncbi:TetR/AcrR family transcriptional regulator [Paenibacillus sp. YPG26]|uniref:TetR/AcrR family transcriptional regulator n=1 Tax=Paenibacillus sp. YPG26 TaxID=2878915 RepID=UPI00203DBC95|nr:TetR/AcrR family transcriptional regulator [Paenibacillus sp. YPG26]USB32915.1 TetR/AcrR family transcriptional regulator [Paenibacillus sp. YPG26]